MLLCWCHIAAGIAEELLQTPDEDLECNARKLKHFAQEELKNIVASATLERAPRVQSVVGLIVQHFSGDTQQVEGINSIIRLVGNRCPRISLRQLSARIVLKKCLGLESLGHHRKKWSVVKTLAGPF